MELFYGELRKFSFTSFTKTGNRITVDKRVLSIIGIDEVFKLVTTATFITNSGAKQDLSIIFKLKFATDIVLDSWNEVMSVQMGGILVLNANDTALINSNANQDLEF